MARVINRFPGEIVVSPIGTPLKTFWRSFSLPASPTASKQYSQKVESFGELEGDVDGHVDISNVCDITLEGPRSKQSVLLRTAMTDRKIVFINDVQEHRFFSSDFSYQHDSPSTTVVEFFSDLDLIQIRLSNQDASVNIFGTVVVIPSFSSKFLSFSSPESSISKLLRLELFSKNLEQPVVGSRVNYMLKVKLSTLGIGTQQTFETTIEASTLHDKRWQMEYRLESNA